MHHLGAFAENAVCAFHSWEEFQGRTKIGFPVFFCFFFVPDNGKHTAGFSDLQQIIL
jgi:hypothetical protein